MAPSHKNHSTALYAEYEEEAGPILTPGERGAIDKGRWFSQLGAALRHDILRCIYVRRYHDGELIQARGDYASEWQAVARGAVRVSCVSVAGKQITLDYIEPGIWFGDVALLDGDRRTHDTYAFGDTTLVAVSRADFHKILHAHVQFYDALLRLQARRIRLLFGLIEDLNSLPLRARLAKQLLHLQRSHGVPCTNHHTSDIRISLHLAQEDLAQLLGASRQRVNQELKFLEREGAIRIETGGMVVCGREMLLKISTEVSP